MIPAWMAALELERMLLERELARPRLELPAPMRAPGSEVEEPVREGSEPWREPAPEIVWVF